VCCHELRGCRRDGPITEDVGLVEAGELFVNKLRQQPTAP